MRNNYDFIISHYTSPLAEEPPVQLTWKMAVAFPAIASVGLLVVFLFFDDIQVSALPLLIRSYYASVQPRTQYAYIPPKVTHIILATARQC